MVKDETFLCEESANAEDLLMVKEFLSKSLISKKNQVYSVKVGLSKILIRKWKVLMSLTMSHITIFGSIER